MPTAPTGGRTTRHRSSCRRGWDIAPRTRDTASSSKSQRGRLGAGKRPGNGKKQGVSQHETKNSPHSRAQSGNGIRRHLIGRDPLWSKLNIVINAKNKTTCECDHSNAEGGLLP